MSTTEITSEQVREWMLAQVPTLQAITPDYIALTCRVQSDNGKSHVAFNAYASGAVSTGPYDSPEEALAMIQVTLTEEDRERRERIRELRAELLRLEAATLPA